MFVCDGFCIGVDKLRRKDADQMTAVRIGVNGVDLMRKYQNTVADRQFVFCAVNGDLYGPAYGTEKLKAAVHMRLKRKPAIPDHQKIIGSDQMLKLIQHAIISFAHDKYCLLLYHF